jgi:endonuclease III
MQNEIITLKNNNVLLTFYAKTENRKPYILGKDLTDVYNETSFFTKKTRNIEKIWKNIVKTWDEQPDRTFQQMVDVAFVNNLDPHTYCQVD